MDPEIHPITQNRIPAYGIALAGVISFVVGFVAGYFIL
jgi:hypothetical protein